MDVTMTSAVVVVLSCCIGAPDSLADKICMAMIVFAVNYMGVAEAARGADLVAVHWVQWMVRYLTDYRVGTIVVLGFDSRAGKVVDGIDRKPAA